MKSIYKSYKILFPEKKDSFQAELFSCIRQLIEISEEHIILYSTFFIQCNSKDDYLKLSFEVSKNLGKSTLEIHNYSIVAQTPLEFSISVEVCYCYKETCGVESKRISNQTYSLITFNSHTEVYAFGIQGNIDIQINKQCEDIFSRMDAILKNEKLDFSDIVRQWNYVEDILGKSNTPEGLSQNYQILNNIRANYYNKNTFKNGYPAATGIGVNAGGICIDFIAIKPSKTVKVYPIKNHIQADAYKYSSEVLVGEAEKSLAPPMFERGKIIQTEFSEFLLSGTAAIVGEKTVYSESVKAQTEQTVENIKTLLSSENLIENNFNSNSNIPGKLLRIYIRNDHDIQYVKKIINDTWDFSDIIYLQCDICRNDLLLEIEGVFS